MENNWGPRLQLMASGCVNLAGNTDEKFVICFAIWKTDLFSGFPMFHSLFVRKLLLHVLEDNLCKG